jgi:hypothetical protein
MHSVLQGSGPAPPSCRGIRFIAFVKYILPTHGLLLSKMDSCGLKWASVAGEDAGVDVGGGTSTTTRDGEGGSKRARKRLKEPGQENASSCRI